MGKKKILLVRIKGSFDQKINDDVAKNVKESIDNFGILVYDERIEIREVEVEGVYWRKENE